MCENSERYLPLIIKKKQWLGKNTWTWDCFHTLIIYIFIYEENAVEKKVIAHFMDYITHLLIVEPGQIRFANTFQGKSRPICIVAEEARTQQMGKS